MTNIEKLKEDTMNAIVDVLRNCDKEDTIIYIIKWAIDDVAFRSVQNVLELTKPNNGEQKK